MSRLGSQHPHSEPTVPSSGCTAHEFRGVASFAFVEPCGPVGSGSCRMKAALWGRQSGLGLLCFSSHISGPFPLFPKCPAPCSSHTHSGSAAQEILRPSPAVKPHACTCSSLVPREGHSRAHTLPSGSWYDPCPHLCICSIAWGGLHPSASDPETTQCHPDVQSQTPLMSLVSGTSSQADPRGATQRQPWDIPRSLS